jgi:hypothetical protein
MSNMTFQGNPSSSSSSSSDSGTKAKSSTDGADWEMNQNQFLLQLYESREETSDVTFIVGTYCDEFEFHAHQCVLSFRSKPLYGIVKAEISYHDPTDNAWKERKSTSVHLGNIDCQIFANVLEWIYMGTLPELHHANAAKSLSLVAHRFGCTALKRYAEDMISIILMSPGSTPLYAPVGRSPSLTYTPDYSSCNWTPDYSPTITTSPATTSSRSSAYSRSTTDDMNLSDDDDDDDEENEYDKTTYRPEHEYSSSTASSPHISPKTFSC